MWQPGPVPGEGRHYYWITEVPETRRQRAPRIVRSSQGLLRWAVVVPWPVATVTGAASWSLLALGWWCAAVWAVLEVRRMRATRDR